MDYVTWAALGVGLAGVAVGVVALVQVRRANARLEEVTPDIRGLAQRVRGQSAEEAFKAIFSQLETIGRKVGQLEVQMSELDRVVSRAVRRIGLVRYDAHEDIRGELSFALCMLDNRNNGVLITSVYDLDVCRVFVRGILGGRTQHDLMPEEAEALTQALSDR